MAYDNQYIQIPNACLMVKVTSTTADAAFVNVGWGKDGKFTFKKTTKDIMAMPTGGIVKSVPVGGECAVEFNAFEITARNLALIMGINPNNVSGGIIRFDGMSAPVYCQLGIYIPKEGEQNDLTSVDCRMVIGLYKAQIVCDGEIPFSYTDELILPLKFKGLEKNITVSGAQLITSSFMYTDPTTITAANLAAAGTGLPSLADWSY